MIKHFWYYNDDRDALLIYWFYCFTFSETNYEANNDARKFMNEGVQKQADDYDYETTTSAVNVDEPVAPAKSSSSGRNSSVSSNKQNLV